MFLSRNIKSLESLSQQSLDDGKIESKLVEISNSLLINYFIPTDSNFKQDLLPLIFQQVLPLTSDKMPVSIRVQAHSFLSRLCSLLTSFSPSCLLTVFDAPTISGADGGGSSGYNSYGSSSNNPSKKASSVAAEFMMAILLLEPPAQASILIFLVKLLHFLPPKSRERFIGTCHDLLLNSKPEILNRLAIEDWKILVDSFSIATLSTLVNFLINNGQIITNSKSEKTKESEKSATSTPEHPKNVDVKISKAIVIFLEKDPQSILSVVLKSGSLNFISAFIPLIPKHIHVPIKLVKKRILQSLKNIKEDSNEASFALEITKLIMKRERFSDEKEEWVTILHEIEDLWNSPSLMISHKSSIIELVSIAAEQNMIPIDSITRFFEFYNVKNASDDDIFDFDMNENCEEKSPLDEMIQSIPTPILVSLIQLTSVYIKMTHKVPKGFSRFCTKLLFDRDPLIYVAVIKLVTNCFNIMYKILPRMSQKILDSCLNPLPKYFVEQIAVIRMIESIDFKETFPIEKLKYKLSDIIISFLKTPHPSLLAEIDGMIDKLELNLPITQFDWFEQSSSLVYLLHTCSPFIILELLDYSVISASSFPVALTYLSDVIISFSNRLYKDNSKLRVFYNFQNENQVIELSFLLFSRALYVIIEAIKVLKLEIRFLSSLQKHHATNEWEGIVSNLANLYDVMNESLPLTVFGKVISSCLVVLSSTIKYLNFLSLQKAADIVKIATIFATAFTPQTCKLVSEVSQRVENSLISHEAFNNNSQFQSKYQSYHQELMKFFSSSFQYEYAVDVSLTAIECITEFDLKVVSDYIRFASNFNRIVLLMNKTATESHFLDKEEDVKDSNDESKSNNENENDEKDKITDENETNNNNNEDSKLKTFKSFRYKTFLAFKNDPDMADYVSECSKEIPFEEWDIEEGDLLYFSKLKNIEVNNYDVLDSIHKKAIKLHPDSFVIKAQKEAIDTSLVLEEISDQIRLTFNPTVDDLFLKNDDLNEEDLSELEMSLFADVKPFSPFKGFQPNSSLLFGFLWNSKRRLSDEDFMKMQDYAMSLKNTRITASFLSYSSRLNITSSPSSSFVDVSKWVKLIHVNRFDFYSILSFVVLSTFIRKSWDTLTKDELKLIKSAFLELGYHDCSAFSVVKIFKEETGVNRMFAEAVAAIDPSRFGEFPLFGDIFLGRENFIARFDDILDAIPSNIRRRRRSQSFVGSKAQSMILAVSGLMSAVKNNALDETESENLNVIKAKSEDKANSDKFVLSSAVLDKQAVKSSTEQEAENKQEAEKDESTKQEPSAKTSSNENTKQEPSAKTSSNEDAKQEPSAKISSNENTKQEPSAKTSSNEDDEKVANKSGDDDESTKQESSAKASSIETESSNDDAASSGKAQGQASSDEFAIAAKDESASYDEQSQGAFDACSSDMQPFELRVELSELFSRFLSPLEPLSKHEQLLLPRGVPLIDRGYFPLSIELDRFKTLALGDSGDDEFARATHEKLLSVAESSSLCDSFIFFVLLHLGLTDHEYRRLLATIQRLTKSHSLNVHLAMADLSFLATIDKSKIGTIGQKSFESTFSENVYIPLSRCPSLALTPSTSYQNCVANPNYLFDGNKPPSYTREFVSLLTSPHLPTNISMNDITSLSKSPSIKSVFFPLLFKGFERFSTHFFDFTSPSIQIRDEDYLLLTNSKSFHITSPLSSEKEAPVTLTNDTLNKLKSYFTKVTKTTSTIAEEFFKMNPASLCKCFNTVSADAAFIEISEKLIDAVINSPNYLTVAVEIMKAIVDHTEVMQMCMIANSESFLNAKLFVCVFLMLKIFEKKLERSDDVAFKEMWEAMKQSMPEKVNDKERLEILTMKDPLEAFAKVFHYSI